MEQYVNDRPYAANSFMSVALGRLFTTALNGKSKERQELAETAIPLTAKLPVIAARGGEDVIRRLFEPLGYAVSSSPLFRWMSSSLRGVSRRTLRLNSLQLSRCRRC